jgi:hypothetical protein
MTSSRLTSLDQASVRIQLERTINNKILHQTKLLLKLYRNVVWSVEANLNDLEVTAGDFGSRRIQDLINYLAFDFEGDLNNNKVGDYLQNVAETKDLILLIDRALIRLKSYPHWGEQYFDLINRKYIIRYAYSDQDLLETMNLTRPTYYRRKREAIHLLGVILWGYILPELKLPIDDIKSDLANKQIALENLEMPL